MAVYTLTHRWHCNLFYNTASMQRTHRVSSDALISTVSCLPFGTFGSLKTKSPVRINGCKPHRAWTQEEVTKRKCAQVKLKWFAKHSLFCQGFLFLPGVQPLHFCPDRTQQMSIKANFHAQTISSVSHILTTIKYVWWEHLSMYCWRYSSEIDIMQYEALDENNDFEPPSRVSKPSCHKCSDVYNMNLQLGLDSTSWLQAKSSPIMTDLPLLHWCHPDQFPHIHPATGCARCKKKERKKELL